MSFVKLSSAFKDIAEESQCCGLCLLAYLCLFAWAWCLSGLLAVGSSISLQHVFAQLLTFSLEQRLEKHRGKNTAITLLAVSRE